SSPERRTTCPAPVPLAQVPRRIPLLWLRATSKNGILACFLTASAPAGNVALPAHPSVDLGKAAHAPTSLALGFRLSSTRTTPPARPGGVRGPDAAQCGGRTLPGDAISRPVGPTARCRGPNRLGGRVGRRRYPGPGRSGHR